MKVKEFFRVAWSTAVAIVWRIQYGHACYICGKPISKDSMLVDYCINCAKKREALGEEKI